MALEAIGTPINFTQSQKGLKGGVTIPGMGDWSVMFKKELEHGSNLDEEFYDEIPPIEIPQMSQCTDRDKTDNDLEVRIGSLDNIKPKEPNIDLKSVWDEPGLVDSESVWGELVKYLIAKDLISLLGK